MSETCPKCKHVNPMATGAVTEACPACGVIYAKARMAASDPISRSPPVSKPTRSQPRPSESAPRYRDAAAEFIEELRATSHYPAFRTVVSFATWCGYIVAAILFTGAFFTWWKAESAGIWIGGMVFAIIIAITARVFREVSLMLADMSDATIRMARRQDAASD